MIEGRKPRVASAGHLVGTCIFLAAVGAACGPIGAASSPPSASGERSLGTQRPALKRITAITPFAVDFVPNSVTTAIASAPLGLLVNPGLGVRDDRGAWRPVLAEAIPTLENGLWRVFPDGRMETTWRIREAASWHDGAPFTPEDLLFTLMLGRDRELPALGSAVYGSLGDAAAREPHTFSITWQRPYVEADFMFTVALARPLPRHLLEQTYRDEKASLMNHPYWTHDFVGTGPYQIREMVPGSHVLLRANDRYVLGRPNIDEIELRIVPDPTTLTANVLAGSIDVTLGTIGSVDQAIEARSHWQGGKVSFEFDRDAWIVMYPQFIDPQPAAVADVRLRRALLHAIDRQEMADALQAGLGPVAHTFMSPNQPDYREIEARVVRYGYDPQRATQMIEGLGYTKGADGTLRDSANQKLELEIRSGHLEQAVKPSTAVAAYWQRIGIAATAVRQAPHLFSDWEYRATFSGFDLRNQPNDLNGLPHLHGSHTRLPENHFRVPGQGNWSRYLNAEFDALLDSYFAAIPKGERAQVLGQIVHHISDHLNVMGLYYSPTPEAISDRMMGVTAARVSRGLITWNAHEWDVRS